MHITKLQVELIFILFFVLGPIIVAIILSISEKFVQVKLSRSGVKVDGHITDHRTVSGRAKSYYLMYDYDYNGLTYSRKEEVRSDRYKELNDGGKVSVSCLPEHPKTARLGYKIPDSMVGSVTLILIGIAGVIIIIGLWLLGYGAISGLPT